MKRIVVFASGSGSNAENIIKFFKHSKTAKVTTVLCNNAHAKVFERCKKLETKCLHFNKHDFSISNTVLNILKNEADFIVLAGFLWRIPQKIVTAFPNKIINIHPALLPKYGGKGMYGMHVHDAVVKNNESETGVTIHYVNEHYDEGAIVFQAKCAVHKTDSSTEVAAKIHQLEMEHFPKVIQNILLSDV